jgi:Protein of unknown function (DUF2510)
MSGSPTRPTPVGPLPPAAPPAGWYQNPEGSGQRYWDGGRWTDHFHHAPPPPAAQPRSNLGGAVILGILFPIIGWIWGIHLLIKNQVGPGIGVLLVSTVAFFVWLAVVGSSGLTSP